MPARGDSPSPQERWERGNLPEVAPGNVTRTVIKELEAKLE